MNFFGHAAVAGRYAPNSVFALGAMLPDFASMSGNRIVGVRDETFRAGIELHHATDPAFVTQRLHQLLAPRKRLAFADAQIEVVESWVLATRPKIAERAQAIMGLVQDGLALCG